MTGIQGGLVVVPESVIDSIRQQVNIVEIIGQQTQLKRRGSNWQGLCPFPEHVENTPSFTVSPGKGIYKCFGCGRSGNVFTFMRDFNGMSFLEAVKQLGQLVGIEVISHSNNGDLTGLLHAVNKRACREYQRNLKGSWYADRGLTTRTVKSFGLGQSNGNLYRSLSKKFDHKQIMQSQLFVETDSFVVLERLSGRYTFPFFDLQGNIIGFAGGGPKRQPKYLNGVETEVYKKSSFLYGLFNAQRAMRDSGEVILVEGYLDVLRLAQRGYCNVVSLCGTALTAAHGKLLKRFAEKAVLFFDGDPAGRRAVGKSFAPLFENGLDVFVADCPDGLDPDNLAGRKNALKTALRGAQSWFEYVVVEDNDPQFKLALAGFLSDVAEDIDNLSRRELFLGLCADRMRVSLKSLQPSSPQNGHRHNTGEGGIPKCVLVNYNEALVLAAMVQERRLCKDFRLDASLFLEPVLRKIYGLLCEKRKIRLLWDALSPKEAKVLSAIIAMAEKQVDTEVAVRNLTGVRIKESIDRLVKKIHKAEASNRNTDSYREQLTELVSLRAMA